MMSNSQPPPTSSSSTTEVPWQQQQPQHQQLWLQQYDTYKHQHALFLQGRGPPPLPPLQLLSPSQPPPPPPTLPPTPTPTPAVPVTVGKKRREQSQKNVAVLAAASVAADAVGAILHAGPAVFLLPAVTSPASHSSSSSSSIAPFTADSIALDAVSESSSGSSPTRRNSYGYAKRYRQSSPSRHAPIEWKDDEQDEVKTPKKTVQRVHEALDTKYRCVMMRRGWPDDAGKPTTPALTPSQIVLECNGAIKLATLKNWLLTAPTQLALTA